MPRLSILLPTYNGARFLREQVGSIRTQTFTDWELLVCDDGSSDGTIAMIDELAAIDRRIRRIPGGGNLGQKIRLGQLADEARGDLIAISDQDDIWIDDKLEQLTGTICGADIAFGDSCLIDAAGGSLGRTLLESTAPPFAPTDRLIYLFRAQVSAHAMVLRRPLLRGIALYRSEPFDWLLSLEAAFANGVVYTPAARTLHRMHDSNQMNGILSERKVPLKLISLAQARVQLNDITTRRFTFMARAEHLAYSNHVPQATAKAFRQVHDLCWRSWFARDRSQRRDRSDLPARLAALLRPLAGSEHDWHHCERALASIVQNVISPRRMMRHVGRKLMGQAG